MRRSSDVVEVFVRMLAQRELERVQNERRKERDPNKRKALYVTEELILSWVDELDATKHFESQEERLKESFKIGGTD